MVYTDLLKTAGDELINAIHFFFQNHGKRGNCQINGNMQQ